MANKTMHHAVIGADTFELIDEGARAEIASVKEDLSESVGDLKSAISESDGGLNEVTKKIGINLPYSTISNASISSGKFIESSSGFTLYIFPVHFTSSVIADGLDVYGFFDEKPAIGVYTYNNSDRVMVSGGHATISIPSGVNYIAMRKSTSASAVTAKTAGNFEEKVNELSDFCGYTYYGFANPTDNKYINRNGALSDNSSYAVSDTINLKAGQSVLLVATGNANNVSMISSVSNGTYTPLVISIDGSEREYTYTATEDIDVVLSYRKASNHVCNIGYYSSSIAENVNKLNNNVLPVAQIDFSGATEGYYINTWGEPSENLRYSYTKPFNAKPGDTIKVTVTGYSDAVAVISEKIGDRYIMVVRSTSSTETEYVYSVNHIGQYVISYRNASEYSGYIIKDILSTFRDGKKLPYIDMFTNMAGLGDSLMSGVVFKGANWYDCKNYSWLSMLARSIGAKWYCYSQGGYTTKDWLNGGYKTMFENLSELPDCVFVAFGTNDRNNQATIPTGTASDSSSSETFCGYYKKIIEIVHTKTPGAIIFCCSLYDNYDSSSIQYSSLIYEIVRQYTYCHFIDIANNAKISRKVTNDYAEGDHFTTVGYLYISELIKTLVNDAIESAPANYKYFGYDNTSN